LYRPQNDWIKTLHASKSNAGSPIESPMGCMVASSRIYFWTKVKQSADSVAEFFLQHGTQSRELWARRTNNNVGTNSSRDELTGDFDA
jgi:hypothetical protein